MANKRPASKRAISQVSDGNGMNEERAGGAERESDEPDVERPGARRTIPPGYNEAERLTEVLRARNPLLEAASVLLHAQADLPERLDASAAAVLRDLLVEELDVFNRLCAKANIRQDHMISARYCLCTALDEAAMLAVSRGKDRKAGNVWSQSLLAIQYHGDRDGGDKVYLLIGRLMQEPDEHRDLLQIIYHILSCGFEGRYRHDTNGAQKHKLIRTRIYTEIMRGREPVPQALSPNAYSDVQLQRKRPSFHEFPVWITVTVLSMILLGQFGWYKYQLAKRSEEVRRQIADIGKMMSPPVPILRLKQLLNDEIAAGIVGVDENASRSAVTFRGDAMFDPGGVAVKGSIAPLIAKIAGEIVKVPGKVTVFGYTDNVPIAGRFASNQSLSEERATQVIQLLQTAGVPASRLEAVGNGDANPVADNRTVQGRARNRRVEMLVEP